MSASLTSRPSSAIAPFRCPCPPKARRIGESLDRHPPDLRVADDSLMHDPAVIPGRLGRAFARSRVGFVVAPGLSQASKGLPTRLFPPSAPMCIFVLGSSDVWPGAVRPCSATATASGRSWRRMRHPPARLSVISAGMVSSRADHGSRRAARGSPRGCAFACRVHEPAIAGSRPARRLRHDRRCPLSHCPSSAWSRSTGRGVRKVSETVADRGNPVDERGPAESKERIVVQRISIHDRNGLRRTIPGHVSERRWCAIPLRCTAPSGDGAWTRPAHRRAPVAPGSLGCCASRAHESARQHAPLRCFAPPSCAQSVRRHFLKPG